MVKSLGDQFRDDDRIRQAKDLLKETLEEYQQKLVGPAAANMDLTEEYAKCLKHMGELRGRGLFFPYIGSGLGRGALVELADGSIKYDFITGIGVHIMGHSHPQVLEACIDAALEDTVMQGNLQQNKMSMDLMDLISRTACKNGAGLHHCFLTTSGAMANENAFKIIFQKKQPAHRFLAFKKCFSGRSLATAQMTDKPEYRQGVPSTFNVDYLPFLDPSDVKTSIENSLTQLKVYLKENKGEYAGMNFELIQGEGGYYPGNHDFFVAIMEELKKNNVAVMIDEIQTFGRTQEPFAFQHFGLDKYADVVTIGKMSQVCATLFTPEYNPQPGLLSQTFTASTASLYTSKFILDELLNNGYFGKDGKINQLSHHFIGRLEQLSQSYPDWIKGPFGLGAMVGFTFKDGSRDVTKKFLMRLFEAGVMGFVAGADPVRIRFLMPILTVENEDIDHVCRIIEQIIIS